jgi:hypothetical protein
MIELGPEWASSLPLPRLVRRTCVGRVSQAVDVQVGADWYLTRPWIAQVCIRLTITHEKQARAETCQGLPFMGRPVLKQGLAFHGLAFEKPRNTALA